MDRIRKLALASTVTAFLLIGIGGLVRATKSGLGCGDNWPHCPGEVTRAMIIESSHRAVAGLLVILLGSLAVTAWKRREATPSLLRPCLAAFGLVLFQALLGAIVVWLHLEAESVVLHLAAAMTLFALLIFITAKTYALEDRRAHEDASVSRSASAAAAAVLALLLVGSYVTGRNAGYVFGDWPLMNGALIPDLHIELYAIHFFHRALAAAVGVFVFAVGLRIIRRKEELPLQSTLAHVAMGAYAIEVLVGAANVWTKLNAGVVTLHLILGALIWGFLVGIAIVSKPLGARVTEPRHRRSQAALETTGS